MKKKNKKHKQKGGWAQFEDKAKIRRGRKRNAGKPVGPVVGQ